MRTERLPATIRVLVVASFLVALGYGIVAPALPVFASSFDVGVAAASAVVSAFAVFRLAFAPVSGRLVGRIGERRVFCGGLLVVAVSSGACAFAASYGQLLVFRALGGIGSTMFTVAAASLLVRLSPAHLRGRVTGTWATAFLLGSVAGPVQPVSHAPTACVPTRSKATEPSWDTPPAVRGQPFPHGSIRMMGRRRSSPDFREISAEPGGRG